MARGVNHQSARYVSFPRIAFTDERKEELRSDKRFRNRFQPQCFNHERTIIEELPINMIGAFPVSDALHLFDLGISESSMTDNI